MADKNAQEIIDGLMRDLQRAAALGLIPSDGARISARGEFIINPSNIEEEENKRMRFYRHQEYPRDMHGWGVDEARPEAGEGPLSVTVLNKEELDNALAAGWSLEPLHGPRGKFSEVGEADAPEPVEEARPKGPVRTFAPPGALSGRASKAPKAPKADEPKADKPAKPKKEPKAPKAPKADAAPKE